MKYLTSAILVLFCGLLYAQQETKLVASNGDSYDKLGMSVDVSGNWAIAGAPEDEPNGSKSGSVYIYQLVNGTWEEKQNLIPSDGSADDQFGYSVSISGDWAAVGAPYYGPSATQTDGKVYIYKRSNSNNWYLFASFQHTSLDKFGFSVSIDNDYLAVGGTNMDVNINGTVKQSGGVVIYRYNGSIWAQQAVLAPSDGNNYDEFGKSVSISGNQVVVGSWHNDGAGTDAGAAYVYSRVGSTWTEDAKLTASDAAALDNFGCSVAILDNDIIVGSNRDDDKGSNSGSAYFYHLSGGTWTEQTKVTAFDGASNEFFGTSVAFISPNNAVIGADRHKVGASRTGAAYLYQFDATSGDWIENTNTNQILASNGANYDYFGVSVAGDGSYVFVGSYRDDNDSNPSDRDWGSVYAYDVSQIILPVRLGEWQARALDNRTVELTWKTYQEKNNEGFVVERSTDGYNWTRIGWVAGQGNSDQVISYRFLDLHPAAGMNYYRLRQKDYDGKATISDIVSVSISHASGFAIFPNPATQWIRISTADDRITEATFYDLQGRVIRRVPHPGHTIQIGDLPHGTYILSVTNEAGERYSQKLLKR